MSSFVFIKYDGDDAGDVLVTILHVQGGGDIEVHDVTPDDFSERQPFGFSPNELTIEPESEEEEDDENPD